MQIITLCIFGADKTNFTITAYGQVSSSKAQPGAILVTSRVGGFAMPISDNEKENKLSTNTIIINIKKLNGGYCFLSDGCLPIYFEH